MYFVSSIIAFSDESGEFSIHESSSKIDVTLSLAELRNNQ